MLQKVCIDEKNQNRILHYNLQWFAKDGEGGEKTEPATAKKLKDARDEGKVAKSRELNSAFDLIVLFLCLKIFVSFVGEKFIDIFSYIYENMPDFVKINEGGLSVQAVAGLIAYFKKPAHYASVYGVWICCYASGQHCAGRMESFHKTNETGTFQAESIERIQTYLFERFAL